MKKQDLINAIAEKSGLTKAQSDDALKAVTEALVECAKAEDKIVIPGLGTFSGEMRGERTARNPKTGETIAVPAKRVMKFKASSGLEL